ncbi:MAG: MFS transporter [Fuerstia sp.]|nr:MFS transporter [Fuerstiella sp.]
MTDETKSSESGLTEVQPPGAPALDGQSYKSARGFASLVVTQFLGAANDNILKGILIYMVIDGSWTGRLGAGGQGIVSLCLSLPFIVLSGIAGEYADRYSKRDVAVVMKIAEIPIGLVAMFGFWIGNLWLTLFALLALSSQSAIFGPAKYGMIPELVPSRSISRANGIINMLTNLAVIVGTLAAGWIADAYSPLPSSPAEPSLLLPGIAILLVAVAGVISVAFMTKLPPGNPSVRYPRNPFTMYSSAIRKMAESPLLLIALADGYFYFLAGLALLILPEYTVVLKAWNVTRAEVSLLLGILGIAIGLGSAVAGFVSGHAIRPILIPIGAAGLSLFFFLLGTVPPTIPDVPPGWSPALRIVLSSHSLLILGAGFSAGFYIIPLQSLLQHRSPPAERGRFLGTASAISFMFLTLAAIVYPVIRPAFGQHPEKIFLVCCGLIIAGMFIFMLRLRSTGLTLAPVVSE